jgi:hypothetical protein
MLTLLTSRSNVTAVNIYPAPVQGAVARSTGPTFWGFTGGTDQILGAHFGGEGTLRAMGESHAGSSDR